MCNFVAAMYIFHRIGKKPKESQSSEPRKTVYKRAWKTIGYDCWVCVYTIELIFGMVWTSMGSAWLNAIYDDTTGTKEELQDKEECKEDYKLLIDMTWLGTVLFWLYLVVGIALFILTLCIMSWKEDGETGCEGCLDCVTCRACGFKKASEKRKKKLEERRLKNLGLERKGTRSDKFLGFMGFGRKRDDWMEKKYGQTPTAPQNDSGAIGLPNTNFAQTNNYQSANNGSNQGRSQGSQGYSQGTYNNHQA